MEQNGSREHVALKIGKAGRNKTRSRRVIEKLEFHPALTAIIRSDTTIVSGIEKGIQDARNVGSDATIRHL